VNSGIFKANATFFLLGSSLQVATSTAATIETLKSKVGNDAFDEFCLIHDLCPICYHDLLEEEDEKVCHACGFSTFKVVFEQEIPFGETRTPTNLLADGKNLGGTLQEKGAFCTVGNGTGSFKDMPIRMRELALNKVESPKILTLLRMGRLRSQQFGLTKNHIFSNDFAKDLRELGFYLICTNKKVCQEYVDAVFLRYLRNNAHAIKYVEAEQTLNVDPIVRERAEAILDWWKEASRKHKEDVKT
jgi:hypothetical protein